MFKLLEKINPLNFKKRRYAYLDTVKTEAGKTCLHDILSACGIHRQVATNDAISIARQQGQRDIALHILNMLNLSDKDMDDLLEQMNKNNTTVQE